jgi:hypothetical protein
MGKTDSASQKAIIMAAADVVAVALDDLVAGDKDRIKSLLQETITEFEVIEPVPYGHKVCVRPLAKGSKIVTLRGGTHIM